MARDYFCKDCGHEFDYQSNVEPIKCTECGMVKGYTHDLPNIMKCPKCGCEWLKIRINQIK